MLFEVIRNSKTLQVKSSQMKPGDIFVKQVYENKSEMLMEAISKKYNELDKKNKEETTSISSRATGNTTYNHMQMSLE